MEIIDYEQRCVDQGILSRGQINEVRNFFMNILEKGKCALEFVDFCRFIQTLSQVQVDPNNLHNFFKMFDSNGDGKLDWNEYLQQLMEFLMKGNRWEYLKRLVNKRQQHQYLVGMQIIFLTQPFQQNELNLFQQELIPLEISVSHHKMFKSYYLLVNQQIVMQNSLQQEKYIVENNIQEMKEILYLIVQQRIPILQQCRKYYIEQILNVYLNECNLDMLINYLISEDQQTILLILQVLTLLVNVIYTNGLPKINKLALLGEQLLMFLEYEDTVIQQQTLLLLGNLILWNNQYINFLLQRRELIMNMKITTQNELLYHSWFLSTIFGRYDKAQIPEFIVRMNQLSDNAQWAQNVMEYFSKHFIMVDNNHINIAIQINLFCLVCPFIVTRNQNELPLSYIINSLQTVPKLRQIGYSVIKKIFKWPQRLSFQNHQVQIYLFQNQMLEILLSHLFNNELKEKTANLIFNILCIQNSQFVLRYLEDTNTLYRFLQLLLDLLPQITLTSYSDSHISIKLLIMNVLTKFSVENATAFQCMAKKHILFLSFQDLLQTEEQAIVSLFANKPKIRNLHIDDGYFENLKQFYSSYLKHFQSIFSLSSIERETLNVIEEMVPNQMIILKLQEYCTYLLNNLKDWSPLIVKRYLKSIHNNISTIVQEIYIFSQQLLEFLGTAQCFSLKQLLQNTINQLSQFIIILTQQKDQIDDILLLIGSEITQDGCVIAIVYLNEYKNDHKKCKVILKPSLKLIDFEKEVEKGLNTTTPLLYLVINQHAQTKIPYDHSLIDEHAFISFKSAADRLIDTPYGSIKIPQEVIAVDLNTLKQWDFSMKKVFELLHKGSQYFQFRKIQDNSMLWFLENAPSTRGLVDKYQTITQLHTECRLTYEQVENLLDSLINYFTKNRQPNQFPKIAHNDFIDYLNDLGVPFQLGKKIAMYLARSGLNNPIDYTDFICFVAVFLKNYNDTLIMKFTYLLYVNEKGEFGLNELTNYLGDMFEISKTIIAPEQTQQWAKDLLKRIDQNDDGYISFFEYHSLLNEAQYKAKLLDPLHQVFAALTQNTNPYFKRSPLRFV